MIDTNIFQDKTAVYYTLGCKLNFSETSTIGKILRDAGVRTARKGEKADICVVNTCSVRVWMWCLVPNRKKICFNISATCKRMSREKLMLRR